MTRLRFTWLVTLALLAVTTSQAWSRGPKAAKTAAKTETTCTVYALKDLGNDPKFVEWVANTIPQVIKPGTWASDHTVTCYPERQVVVVYHTAAVQAEVAAYLDSLKKAMPKEKAGAFACGTMPPQQVMPASYTPAPALLKSPNVMTIQKNVYPIPPPLQQPKHLFHMILQGDMLGDSGMTDLVKDLSATYLGTPAAKEESKDESKDQPKSETPKTSQANPSFTFIIRYEGEGIVDNNVADLLKAIYAPKKDAESSSSSSAPAPGVIVQTGYTAGPIPGQYVTPPPEVVTPLPPPVMPAADGEAKPQRRKRAPQSPAPEAPQAPSYPR